MSVSECGRDNIVIIKKKKKKKWSEECVGQRYAVNVNLIWSTKFGTGV